MLEAETDHWTIDSTFSRHNQHFRLLKSLTPQKRRYSLAKSPTRSWFSYRGAHGQTGQSIRAAVPLSKRASNGRSFLFSNGPWWIDPNHAHPGYGSLHLIFFTPVDPMHTSNHELPIDAHFIYPNMQSMTIQGALRGDHINLQGSDLLFWFQCYSKKINRYVNYALIDQPLNKHLLCGELSLFSLTVDIRQKDQWVCLGSSTERSDLYGDLPISELELDKVINCGFILTPIELQPIWQAEADNLSLVELAYESKWPINTDLLPTGCIALYDLQIDYDSHYLLQTVK